jgi:multicomponent Na+:H+ antiporter subunit E
VSTTGRILLRGAVLVAVWVALWGRLSVANVASGVVVAALVMSLSPVPQAPGLTLRPLPALRYAAVFSWLLVASTYDVTREVLRPRIRLREGIVAVPLRTGSTVIATVVANTLTLTPGTLTVEVGAGSSVLYVHALQARDPDRLRAVAARLETLAARTLLADPDRGTQRAASTEQGEDRP